MGSNMERLIRFGGAQKLDITLHYQYYICTFWGIERMRAMIQMVADGAKRAKITLVRGYRLFYLKYTSLYYMLASEESRVLQGYDYTFTMYCLLVC